MIIGITGKSGAGKTTICKCFGKKLNMSVINLDEVIHYLMNQNKEYTVEVFGSEILKEEKINRIALGDKIFSMRSHYKEYTNFIYQKTLETIEPYLYGNIIIEHILLPHMKEIWSQCVTKILIKADDDTRQKRIEQRDNISLEYFNLRESASIEYDEDDFDVIIKNNKENIWI